MKVTKGITICALVIQLICSFTEVARGQQASSLQPLAQGMITESSQDSAPGPPESNVANANNPIAPMNAIYFQNYYAPTVYGVPGPNNLLDIRSILISGRQIIRATLAILSSDLDNGDQVSGLGDFNVFGALRVPREKSRNVLAVGPPVVAPTATNHFRGQGKWQAGFIDLGPIEAKVGDQNYAFGPEVDLSRYRAVSVWCKRFILNFGTAPSAAEHTMSRN